MSSVNDLILTRERAAKEIEKRKQKEQLMILRDKMIETFLYGNDMKANFDLGPFSFNNGEQSIVMSGIKFEENEDGDNIPTYVETGNIFPGLKGASFYSDDPVKPNEKIEFNGVDCDPSSGEKFDIIDPIPLYARYNINTDSPDSTSVVYEYYIDDHNSMHAYITLTGETLTVSSSRAMLLKGKTENKKTSARIHNTKKSCKFDKDKQRVFVLFPVTNRYLEPIVIVSTQWPKVADFFTMYNFSSDNMTVFSSYNSEKDIEIKHIEISTMTAKGATDPISPAATEFFADQYVRKANDSLAKVIVDQDNPLEFIYPSFGYKNDDQSKVYNYKRTLTRDGKDITIKKSIEGYADRMISNTYINDICVNSTFIMDSDDVIDGIKQHEKYHDDTENKYRDILVSIIFDSRVMDKCGDIFAHKEIKSICNMPTIDQLTFVSEDEWNKIMQDIIFVGYLEGDDDHLKVAISKYTMPDDSDGSMLGNYIFYIDMNSNEIDLFEEKIIHTKDGIPSMAISKVYCIGKNKKFVDLIINTYIIERDGTVESIDLISDDKTISATYNYASMLFDIEDIDRLAFNKNQIDYVFGYRDQILNYARYAPANQEPYDTIASPVYNTKDKYVYLLDNYGCMVPIPTIS